MPNTAPHLSRAARISGLVCWIAVCLSAGGTGAIASRNAGTFYNQLAQLAWAPPAWLFAPVWSVLYLSMGISAWLVWQRHGWRHAGTALALFLAQLAANALWTWIFFAWQRGAMAFAEIVVLWLLIVGTMAVFYRLHRLAAALLLPYLAWVSFATALTWAMWRLNPAILG